MVRIVTWNINGIRSLKDEENWTVALQSQNADVVCLQETKITRDCLEEPVALVDGYNSYFSFCRKRSGYSGVATFCKYPRVVPVAAEEGISGVFAGESGDDSVGCYDGIDQEFTRERLRCLDSEGRSVITKFQIEDGGFLVVINVYCPRADPERREERETFKLEFYKLLELRALALKKAGNRVVILGDLNTSHKKLDHCDPGQDFEKNPGRHWMDHFLEGNFISEGGMEAWKISEEISVKHHPSYNGGSFKDGFRLLHGEEKDRYTCWNTMKNCRATNFGTRIDYVLLDDGLVKRLRSCDILDRVTGSDHCPVVCDLDLEIRPSESVPSWCTKCFKEFSGKQQTLLNFLKAKTPASSEAGPPAKKRKVQQTSLNSFFTRNPVMKDHQEREFLPKAFEVSKESVTAWKSLMKGPPKAPLCQGHSEPCVSRTVKKPGKNQGKGFWVCNRGEGKADDKEARCDYFKWMGNK